MPGAANAALLAATLITSLTSAATVTYNWRVPNTTQRLDGVLRYAFGINELPGHM
ncbi:hypothetical protein HDU76_009671, partial [Blyttiomyces sp. JEL0837]